MNITAESTLTTQMLVTSHFNQEDRIGKCLILQLSSDLLRLIQQHLPPRHLGKLIQTSKSIKEILAENEMYWARVAAHMTFRGVFFGTKSCLQPTRPGGGFGSLKSHHCPSSWYFMMNLQEGYYQAMNNFLALIPVFMSHSYQYMDDMSLTNEENSEARKYHNPDEYGMQFYAQLPLSAQIRYILSSPHDLTGWGSSFGDTSIHCMTMKEIALRWIELDGNPAEAEDKSKYNKMWKWIRDLDDNQSIPIQTKRSLISSLMEALNPSKSVETLNFFVSSPEKLSMFVVFGMLQPLRQ